MSKVEKSVGTAAGVVMLIGILWGIANSYADKPSREETKTIARQEVNSALDTFKLRHGYEMYYMRKDLDTVKSEMRAFIRSLEY